jgi:hypothetical protein
VRHDETFAGALKQRAPVETEGLDDAAQAILDHQVHAPGIHVHEPGRQVDDQRLEAETLLALNCGRHRLHPPCRRQTISTDGVHRQRRDSLVLVANA